MQVSKGKSCWSASSTLHFTCPSKLLLGRRSGFTSWADPIGLVTFLFPAGHASSVRVAANASQPTRGVKDTVLIWG